MTTERTNLTYLAVDLHDLPAIVVGGGDVATRRVHDLLQSGARVTLIADAVTDDLHTLADEGRINWLERRWRGTDIGLPAVVIHAATGDARLDEVIFRLARRVGKLATAAGSGSRTVVQSEVVRRGDVTVAVHTHNSQAHRAGEWREFIARQLPLETASGESGTVTLVGAGPGDPDLLTIGGRRAIQRADVIVHDGLVSPDVLHLAHPSAHRINVGKDPFGASVPQKRIQEILVAEASAGLHVVRLKGGDPFVFGRGTEELEAVAAAGISTHVIPGVTALTGVLGSAGVAISKRTRNHGFGVFSAAARTPDDDVISWAQLPGPLAIFMGLNQVDRIAHLLQAGGRADSELVTIIARGGTPRERVIETTLALLPHAIGDPREWRPAIIVIGAEREAAIATRDLDGARVAVDGLALDDWRVDALRARGARVARLTDHAAEHDFAVTITLAEADWRLDESGLHPVHAPLVTTPTTPVELAN